jgi:mannosyltransferase OCH1-like enzyme
MNFWFLWGFFENIPMPSKHFRNIIQWHNNNSDISLHILSKTECNKMIEKYTLNKIYGSYKLPIQQCDFFRYYLMHAHGGMYSDIDVVSNLNIINLCRMYPDAKVFLCTECLLNDNQVIQSKSYRIRKSSPEHRVRVANYWFCSLEPKHKFWRKVIRLCEKRASLEVLEPYDVLYTTGPDLITTAYHEYIQTSNSPDVVLLDLQFSSSALRHTCNSLSKESTQSWRSTCSN